MNHQFLEDLWHSRFRSWHEADQVTEVKVRCERKADVELHAVQKNEYANLKWEFIAHRKAALEIIQCDFHLLIFQQGFLPALLSLLKPCFDYSFRAD